MMIKVDQLRKIAREIRQRDLEMVYHAGAGHLGGEMSVIDILTALYFHAMKIFPKDPLNHNRDRFILSKGHAACALYVTLSKVGFFSEDELDTFLTPNSRLNGHPNKNSVPGVEANTGPLGHGLPIATGIALASKMTFNKWMTYVLLGDGELQEGSNWEAAMTASHHQLSKLVAIVDHNRHQQGDRVEATNSLSPLKEKWKAFGWEVTEVDGHDMEALIKVFEENQKTKHTPQCVIAHTIKGKGISFMEDRTEWHHKVPDLKQYQMACKELKNAGR